MIIELNSKKFKSWNSLEKYLEKDKEINYLNIRYPRYNNAITGNLKGFIFEKDGISLKQQIINYIQSLVDKQKSIRNKQILNNNIKECNTTLVIIKHLEHIIIMLKNYK